MGNTTGKPIVEDGILQPESNSRYSPTTEQILKTVSERKAANNKRKSTKHGKKANEDYKMIVNPNETVDGGYLFPHGVYKGKQDYNVAVVRNAIISRQIAPFYKGLDFVSPGIDDDGLLKALDLPGNLSLKAIKNSTGSEPAQLSSIDAETEASHEEVAEKVTQTQLDDQQLIPKLPNRDQLIWLYRNVVECPICFLEYPRLNDTRCCHQQICTECFVNIRRNPAHPPSHSNGSDASDVLELVSESANCPFCAQSGFGITFEAPPFEWGIPYMTNEVDTTTQVVITTDMVRPDWEEKLFKARRKLAKKTAHARALHMSALLPNDTSAPSRNESGPLPVTTEDQARSGRSFSVPTTGLENVNLEDNDSSTSTANHSCTTPESRSRAGSLGFLGFTCGSWKTRNEEDIYDVLKTSNTLPDMVRATNGLSRSQLRALEARMIEQATEASLNVS